VPTCDAADEYYVIVFGQQADPPLPRFTHTWAIFVKAIPLPDGRRQLEAYTISWYPQTGVVRCLWLPEPGVNLDIVATLRQARALEAQTAMLGPYRIQPELYERAVRQVMRLQSGQIRYKAIDAPLRPNIACNCIHALSDIDMDQGLLDTGRAVGVEAARMVVNLFRRWMICPEQIHPWVATALGLDAYAMARPR
jgi:hypothetical protein